MPDLCTFLAHKNRSFLYFLYTEYRGFIISLLHGNPSKCVCHRAEQNDRCKDWAKIFDHKIEDFLSKIGEIISIELVVRGTKHKSNTRIEPEPMYEISSLWQKYIK